VRLGALRGAVCGAVFCAARCAARCPDGIDALPVESPGRRARRRRQPYTSDHCAADAAGKACPLHAASARPGHPTPGLQAPPLLRHAADACRSDARSRGLPRFAFG